MDGGPAGAYYSPVAGPTRYCEQWHAQKDSSVVIPRSHLVESPVVADREANSYFVSAALVVSAFGTSIVCEHDSAQRALHMS